MSENYLGQTIDIILGQEFLTWLWFVSETKPMGFEDIKGQRFSVVMEQRVVVQGGEGESLETATVFGIFSPLREVRRGLQTGKKVIRALLRIEKDELSWQLILKAEDFSFGTFRTPKVSLENDEPDATFLEKIYLIESCLQLIDVCYKKFLFVRLSPEWDKEKQNMALWILHDEDSLSSYK